MFLRLDWCREMSSVTMLVFVTLLSIISVAQSRPRERAHNGLYDDLKPVPFVDNPEEDGYMYGVYSAKLGKKDKASKHESPYNLDNYYDKYNKENDRHINGEGDVSRDKDDIGVFDEPDLTQLPVEGGVDDAKSRLVTLEDEKTKEAPVVAPAEQADVTRDKHKNSQEKEHKTNHRHRKLGKKHKSGKKSEKKKTQKTKLSTTAKPENNDDFLGSVDQKIPGNFDMDKFYKEHPDFKENVATITAAGETATPAVNSETVTTGDMDDVSEDDDSDHDDKDDADIDDDMDDADDQQMDSESNDKSSEEYKFYDYYDEKGDSSYSSSEVAAENANYGTPYDWFKQYEKMIGDQPSVEESKDKELEDKTSTSKALGNIKTTDTITKAAELTSNTPLKNGEDKLEQVEPETVPKTAIEPSTSPNPPTPQKDVRSTVTQPAIPLWKQKLNSWNYIESRPVEACKETSDCTAGRMCKFGLCLCGQPDFCDGHDKPVCGSDGQVYPSHCELHRTACILGFHIRIDHENTCLPKQQQGSLDVLPTGTTHKENKEKSVEVAEPIVLDNAIEKIEKKGDNPDALNDFPENADVSPNQMDESNENVSEESDEKDVLDMSQVSKDVVIGGVIEKASADIVNKDIDEEEDNSKDDDSDSNEQDSEENMIQNDVMIHGNPKDDIEENMKHDYVISTPYTPKDDPKDNTVLPSDPDTISHGEGMVEKVDSESEDADESLVPLFCTPDVYMKFKADVLEYHCIYFDQLHCDKQTQEDKQKLADLMFNYFDQDYDGQIEKEELWKMQLGERIDEISSLCTLLDIVEFDELGDRNGKLSADEFIQAFDIPDLLEHKLEVVPLLTTVGNGLEVKCDVTASTDVVWKRHNVELWLLDFPGISVLSDGSLYIETIGVEHVSNLTCYDRKKPSVKQLHMLTVQKPPHVIVSPENLDCVHGNTIELHCHAEGYPKSTIEWQFDDQTIQQGAKYSIRDYDNSLIVMNANYKKDTGLYKCIARNNAGVAEASVQMTVHPDNETKQFNGIPAAEESFIVFHDDGYTMHEPSLCLTQRHVSPDFSNFFYIPDELDAPPALCETGVPCVWGSAINVRDTFVYATQPRENRIVVIDVKGFYNPNQVIFTDHIPVSLYYVDHLDEVWVLCWNGESDNGSKTIVIIRNASKKIQHHAVHTQPIGNRFDLVQDLYLPPESELHHPWEFGYTVHSGQQGLFKIELVTKKYIKAVDLTKYACVPNSVAFVPLGGHVLVQCIQKSADGDTSIILDLDYITDVVTQNFSMPGVPFVTPDSNNVLIIDKKGGKVSVFKVTDQGAIERQFEVSVESSVDTVKFHKAQYNPGYDLYLVSADDPVLYSVSLTSGKVDTIKNVDQSGAALPQPWAKKSGPLVSGDVFSDYLSTTGQSSMVILDGHHHRINCNFKELSNPSVLTYSRIDK